MPAASSSPSVVRSHAVQPSPIVGPVVDAAFEERWAAWRAKGLRADLALQRRIRWLSVIAAIAGALVILGVIVTGASR